MTVKQKQCLLCYMGTLAPEDIDGLWGGVSAAATKKAQQILGIPDDGVWGPQTDAAIREYIYSGEDINVPITGDWWDEIQYFTEDEPGIACPCGRCGGFPVKPVERLMRNADDARAHFGRPAIPSSTVRCAAHNAELPGSAANSLHMRGKAMDFRILGVTGDELLAYVRTLPDVHEAYKINDSYVHMGVLKY